MVLVVLVVAMAMVVVVVVVVLLLLLLLRLLLLLLLVLVLVVRSRVITRQRIRKCLRCSLEVLVALADAGEARWWSSVCRLPPWLLRSA